MEFPATVCIDTALGYDNEHIKALNKAIDNILSTEISRKTFAQVVDGIPTAEAFRDTCNEILPDDHPIFKEHTEVSVTAFTRLDEIHKSKLSLGRIRVQAKLASSFRSAAPGSRAFIAHLIELSAVVVHAIGVEVFKLERDSHSQFAAITSWKGPPPPNGIPMPWINACPTLLRHTWYRASEQYPEGVADIPGYWAESRIFGGVVLFDRFEKATSPGREESSTVWLHPPRSGGTYRIVKLNEDQRQALVEFLLADSPDMNLLPILTSKSNVTREDPEEAPESIGIYRDVWERRPLREGEIDRRQRHVVSRLEYPTDADLRRAQSRALQRKRALQAKLMAEFDAGGETESEATEDDDENEERSVLETGAKRTHDEYLKKF